jgi:hypothetical protein
LALNVSQELVSPLLLLSSVGENSSSQFELEKKGNWRTMIVNCQSLRGKSQSLETATEYIKPDLILGTESWLDSTVKDSEVFPSNYTVYRNDRNLNGGGVFVAVKSCFNSSAVPEVESNAEIVWAKIQLQSSEDMYVSSFYRPPNDNKESFEQFKHSLESRPPSLKKKPLILGGDFNLPEINWAEECITPGAQKSALCKELLAVAANESLSQIQEEPTRENSILDLYFTNRPGLVKHTQTIPGISDHDIVVVDTDFKAKIQKTKPRKVYNFNKADWEKTRSEAIIMNDELMASFDQEDIDKNWENFKTGILKLMNNNIPSKMTSPRHNLPWLNKKLRSMTKKKHKLYNTAKMSKKTEDWAKFKSLKKDTQKAIKAAHNQYISTILDKSLEDKKPKPFWKYIKQMKKDTVGIAPLKSKNTGKLLTDSKDKAQALNNQFKSVFTTSGYDKPLQFEGVKQPSIGEIHVGPGGVAYLLRKLSPNKASGPDSIPNRILKEIATEIDPFLTKFFNASLECGQLPKDWTQANVTPIFKKGSRHDPANYRPVSLTCVCCKILEHIVCKHILNHLEQHNILTSLQHGFRSGYSCETQLLITVHDIVQAFDKKKQTDMVILDFSKAFDTVPHDRLIQKLEHLGIDGKVNTWIKGFLKNRQQRVLVEGEFSPPVSVDSGVPQGSVLGPLLFLCHINDLPVRVLSQVRMFADDCLLYRQINTEEDHANLQKDLKALEEWAHMWGMSFNATKCYVMRIGRGRSISNWIYTLCGHPLEQVQQNPYLGVHLSDDLKWSCHITKVTKKANNILAFLRRNLQNCPRTLKETAYKTLVRSITEYSCTVWNPHLKGDISTLEAVQRRAARFVMHNYSWESSVTEMMETLGWQSLEQRRREARLVLMYKVVHGLVAIPHQGHIEQNKLCTRSKNSLRLKVYSPSTEIARNSFFPKTIKDWNKLNEDTVTAETIEKFKTRISSLLD